MAFFFLLTIPLIVAVLGFVVLKTISWKEFLVQVGVQLVVAAASVGIIYSSNTWDSEILNGTVLSKAQTGVQVMGDLAIVRHPRDTSTPRV
jgi:hypothetical protein